MWIQFILSILVWMENYGHPILFWNFCFSGVTNVLYILELSIVLEFLFALVSDHVPPKLPKYNNRIKTKNSFSLTLCLTKGKCKKIAWQPWDLGSDLLPALPRPRGPVSDLAVHPVCSGGLCGWGCAAWFYTPHIRDFIPSHGKEKQRLFGLFSFFS